LLLSFQGLLWTVTLATAAFLCVTPLAQELWAYYTWDRVPCWYSVVIDRYFFERDGVRYTGFTHDFWETFDPQIGRSTGSSQMPPADRICYVNPGPPRRAVLNLDAHQRLDHAAPRLGIATLLIVAAAVMSRAARQRRPAAAVDPAKGTSHG
jgi:hypothetical protein